jgi:hypothetical protein
MFFSILHAENLVGKLRIIRMELQDDLVAKLAETLLRCSISRRRPELG